MRRLGLLAPLILLTAASRCDPDINDEDVRIAVTSRVSLSPTGEPNNLGCEQPAVSADGRYLAFVTFSANLTPVPTNGRRQVYVRDLVLGTVEMVSVNDAGEAANADCLAPSLAADGSRVAFQSTAGNLVTGDTGRTDIFVRRRDNGTTLRASLALGGAEPNGDSNEPMISGNGLFVVFKSTATNLLSPAPQGTQIYRRDLNLLVTELVSVRNSGGWGTGISEAPTVSEDGGRVAFASFASDLTGDPDNTTKDIFVRDMTLATTFKISFAEIPADFTNGASSNPFISGDGSRVAFVSAATNLVTPDLNGTTLDVYVRQVSTGPTVRASHHTLGAQGAVRSERPILSHSGRYLAFYSEAPNLVDDDTNNLVDAFWRDLDAGRTIRLSVSTGNIGGNLESGSTLERPALTADGRFGYYISKASNLIDQDINGVIDIFGRGPLY